MLLQPGSQDRPLKSEGIKSTCREPAGITDTPYLERKLLSGSCMLGCFLFTPTSMNNELLNSYYDLLTCFSLDNWCPQKIRATGQMLPTIHCSLKLLREFTQHTLFVSMRKLASPPV